MIARQAARKRSTEGKWRWRPHERSSLPRAAGGGDISRFIAISAARARAGQSASGARVAACPPDGPSGAERDPASELKALLLCERASYGDMSEAAAKAPQWASEDSARPRARDVNDEGAPSRDGGGKNEDPSDESSDAKKGGISIWVWPGPLIAAIDPGAFAVLSSRCQRPAQANCWALSRAS